MSLLPRFLAVIVALLAAFYAVHFATPWPLLFWPFCAFVFYVTRTGRWL